MTDPAQHLLATIQPEPQVVAAIIDSTALFLVPPLLWAVVVVSLCLL